LAAAPPHAEELRDDAVEQVVGNLLRAGVVLAAAITLLGGALYLAGSGGAPADYRVFAGQPAGLRSVRSVVAGALALRAESVIQLGLLVLIATPIARVAFALLAFARQRDAAYVAISALVLTVLLFSLFGGVRA
jgi:uncharacterized membrane protein